MTLHSAIHLVSHGERYGEEHPPVSEVRKSENDIIFLILFREGRRSPPPTKEGKTSHRTRRTLASRTSLPIAGFVGRRDVDR
jgi:hypothetical protein